MSWQASPTNLYRKFEKLLLDSKAGDEGWLNVPPGYQLVTTLHSGHISTRRFFEVLQCLGKQASGDVILVATIEPDPWEYYFRNFNLIPAFEIGDGASAGRFLEELHWGPEKGGADSIACHADKFSIMVDTEAWIIIADHVTEMARLYVSDANLGRVFKQCIPLEWRDWKGYQQ